MVAELTKFYIAMRRRAGDDVAVLLNTFAPDLYVEYFSDLRAMIASGRSLTPLVIIEVMANYATAPATEYAE